MYWSALLQHPSKEIAMSKSVPLYAPVAAPPPDRRCRDVLDLAHVALSGGHRPRRSRGRFFNIDLINKLEADSHAARPHRQLAKPAI
jgi:hypothetical protein